MNTQTKQIGSSFQIKSLYNFIQETKSVNIGGKNITTSAQAMTLIAYGDSNGLPFRNLDFKTECENYTDLIACINIIDSYNEFDAERIKKYTFWRLNLQHFLNSDNANNGRCLFDFHIAREGSPAFYVSWNEKYNNKIIIDKEEIPKSEGQPAGTMLYWEEYNIEDFKESMALLANQIGVDEFNIKTVYTYSDGKQSLTARFWFD